jgi:SAM-dependent methyltransferase
VLTVPDQVQRGILVCPVTREKLVLRDSELRAVGTKRRYDVVDGVPILLADPQAAELFVAGSSRMVAEYGRAGLTASSSRTSEKLKELLARDYRTAESLSAFDRFLEGAGGDSVFLSLGGGPSRAHPQLVNVNIGRFPNVDVVADAHRLPYASGSVRGVFCEAGFEHFSDPDEVVREMFRVLVHGGRVYSVTPFLQAYHGYPDHFQNLTLSGHRRLLERGGFRIAAAGTCVGPLFALFDLATVYINEYFPRPLRFILRKGWRLFGVAIGPLNRRVNRSQNSHVFASTTYCLAEKPS